MFRTVQKTFLDAVTTKILIAKDGRSWGKLEQGLICLPTLEAAINYAKVRNPSLFRRFRFWLCAEVDKTIQYIAVPPYCQLILVDDLGWYEITNTLYVTKGKNTVSDLVFAKLSFSVEKPLSIEDVDKVNFLWKHKY